MFNDDEGDDLPLFEQIAGSDITAAVASPHPEFVSGDETIVTLRSLSLRVRLNLAFAGLLAFGLLADIAVTIRGAGSRIEPETQNAMGLVGGIIQGALGGLHEGPELEPTSAPLRKAWTSCGMFA